MINALHLENFRQHTKLSVIFSEGVTVVRGSNEAGKTSVFEAITFALFGVRACRNSDLTTWGADPSSHRVTLTFSTGGTTYTIRRTARAAELTYEDGRVTGQTEVTRFCEDVLDLKPGMGSKLMFVGQNAVRGILEEGGAKTGQMIETLASFDMIEQWIQVLQTEFGTGKTELYEQSLQHLHQQRETESDQLAEMPTPEDESARIEHQCREVVANAAQMIDAESHRAAQLQIQLDKARDVKLKSDYLQRALAANKALVEDKQRTLDAERLEPFDPTPAEKILKHLKIQKLIWDDYRSAADYAPEVQMHGTLPSLTTKSRNLYAQKLSLDEQMSSLNGQIQALQKQICNDLTCPTCKREWGDAAQRQARNDELRQQMTDLQAQIHNTEGKKTVLIHELNIIGHVLSISVPTLCAGTLWKETGNPDLYPPVYTWSAPLPSEVTQREVGNAQREWEDARRKWNAFVEQDGQRVAARKQLTTLEAEREDLMAQYNSLPSIPNPEELHTQLYAAQQSVEQHRSEMTEAQQTLENLNKVMAPYFRQHAEQVLKVQNLTNEMNRYESTIKDTQLNNTLLRALRTLKPQVANKVWQTVCSTVSHYFSLMRDQSSVVTKGDGFVVDGKEVGSLSGSTLDILGIAIRITLTKTFMPGCRFLFLDEPFAACDVQRQTQALGFITSIGFDQVIVVTHEDTTEAVADNLIAL